MPFDIEGSKYLHFCPARGHQLGIINFDLSLGHIVEALMNDAKALSHLLHTDQVPKQNGKEKKIYRGLIIII